MCQFQLDKVYNLTIKNERRYVGMVFQIEITDFDCGCDGKEKRLDGEGGVGVGQLHTTFSVIYLTPAINVQVLVDYDNNL